MLSRDDGRQLELIESYFELEDPRFAKALGEGRARRPRGDCRWPLRLAVLLAGMVFLAGMAMQAVVVMLVGGVATGIAALAYWRHMARSQRPSRRRPT